MAQARTPLPLILVLTADQSLRAQMQRWLSMDYRLMFTADPSYALGCLRDVEVLCWDDAIADCSTLVAAAQSQRIPILCIYENAIPPVADDYVRKPPEVPQLLARLNLLRRYWHHHLDVDLAEKLQQTLLVKQVTESIRSTLNIQAVFTTAAQQIGQALAVSRCHIFTYQDNPRPEVILVAEYLVPGFASAWGTRLFLDEAPYLAHLLSQDGVSASPNVSEDPMLRNFPEVFEYYQVKSRLVARTSYQGKPNGFVSLHQCDRYREWTAAEIDLAASLAAQLGIAVAHATLLEQEKKQRIDLDRQNIKLQEEIEYRQRVETELRHSQAQNQAILNALPDLIFRVDTSGRILDCKPATEPSLNSLHSLENVVGKYMDEIMPQSLWLKYLQYIRQALGRRTSQVYEQEVMGQDMTHYEEVRVVPGNDEEALLIIRDITARKQSEVAMRQAIESAQASNKAKSEFLARMSHELRTPLNAILGFTQLLRRDSSIGSEQMEYLQTIANSGEHLLQLINDVLCMAKIEAGKLHLEEKNCNLHSLITYVQETLKIRAVSKGIEFHLELAPDLPQQIFCDERKLTQVLLNLLSNAIKFTEKGEVRLMIYCVEIATPGKEQLVELNVVVKDTGVGITPAEMSKLFQPFVQTAAGQRSQQGTGLGLAISQQFVQIMGGEIRVDSIVNQGSTFRFAIPVKVVTAVDPSQGYRQPFPDLSAQIQYPHRILAVDDIPENLQFLVHLLQKLGFSVNTAQNGKEAVALTQAWQPDLIWMDLAMPVMDGYTATREIRQLSLPKQPIIIALTATAWQQEDFLACGGNDYILKPYQDLEIVAKLRQYLGISFTPIQRDSYQRLAQTLANSPAPWLANLHAAARRCDHQKILQLVGEMSPMQSDAAKTITELVASFRFDRLVELTQHHEQT